MAHIAFWGFNGVLSYGFLYHFYRINIPNKPHKPGILLKPKATTFVPNRTFCVYIFTFTTLYVPAEAKAPSYSITPQARTVAVYAIGKPNFTKSPAAKVYGCYRLALLTYTNK
jgi:hypothetical protein